MSGFLNRFSIFNLALQTLYAAPLHISKSSTIIRSWTHCKFGLNIFSFFPTISGSFPVWYFLVLTTHSINAWSGSTFKGKNRNLRPSTGNRGEKPGQRWASNLYMFVWMSDHNSWTPRPIWRKFWMENLVKPRKRP